MKYINLVVTYCEHFFVVKEIITCCCFIVKINSKWQTAHLIKIVLKANNNFVFKYISNTDNLQTAFDICLKFICPRKVFAEKKIFLAVPVSIFLPLKQNNLKERDILSVK